MLLILRSRPRPRKFLFDYENEDDDEDDFSILTSVFIRVLLWFILPRMKLVSWNVNGLRAVLKKKDRR